MDRSLLVSSRSGFRGAADRVVSWVQRQIVSGALVAGQRLPPERELATTIGVSRPSVRSGLRTLSAMRIIVVRQGAGTFIADGPPSLDSKPLGLLSALHQFRRDDLRATRVVLEREAAGLAAERAKPEHVATLADSVTDTFAALTDPRAFASHDLAFHRTLAFASGNPLLGVLVDLLVGLQADQERGPEVRTDARHDIALAHQRIYRAVRRRDARGAREAITHHLLGNGALDHQPSHQHAVDEAARAATIVEVAGGDGL